MMVLLIKNPCGFIYSVYMTEGFMYLGQEKVIDWLKSAATD